MAIHNKIDYPIDEIRQRIAAGETQDKIADDLAKRFDPRISRKLIQKLCKREGIVCHRRGPRSAEGHPEWKGGRIIDRNGYVHLYVPDHPECQRVNEIRHQKANGKYFRKENYIQEHRLVMEKALGRQLLATEVVHHVNGDKQDNRIENLEMFDSNAEHLARTLSGQCPKWTRMGLCRIRAGVLLSAFPECRKFGSRVLANLLYSIQMELKLHAPPSKVELLHWTVQHGTTLEQACEKVLQQQQPQTS